MLSSMLVKLLANLDSPPFAVPVKKMLLPLNPFLLFHSIESLVSFIQFFSSAFVIFSLSFLSTFDELNWIRCDGDDSSRFQHQSTVTIVMRAWMIFNSEKTFLTEKNIEKTQRERESLCEFNRQDYNEITIEQENAWCEKSAREYNFVLERKDSNLYIWISTILSHAKPIFVFSHDFCHSFCFLNFVLTSFCRIQCHFKMEFKKSVLSCQI